MLKLYDLLPEFYRTTDKRLGSPLEKFLSPLQEKLEEIYADQLALAKIQDPDECREDFLKWIAESLQWTFLSQDTPSQRQEAKEIVNFYDLKGTPYAARLFSSLIFGELFARLYEFYEGFDASISSIRADYEDAYVWLRQLLEGEGTFVSTEWKQLMEALRGQAYGFDPEKRLYSYIVYNHLYPQDYVPGTVRPRYEKYIRSYRRWHPAGRFCYVFITVPSFTHDDRLQGDRLLNELAGITYLDSYWGLDDGMTWDAPGDPVHPSLSYIKKTDYATLDSGKIYDDGTWHWDEYHSSMNILIELS